MSQNELAANNRAMVRQLNAIYFTMEFDNPLVFPLLRRIIRGLSIRHLNITVTVTITITLSVLLLFSAQVVTSIYLMFFLAELSPLELSAFLNALSCSLAFHRDASFEFKDLIKEVQK